MKNKILLISLSIIVLLTEKCDAKEIGEQLRTKYCNGEKNTKRIKQKSPEHYPSTRKSLAILPNIAESRLFGLPNVLDMPKDVLHAVNDQLPFNGLPNDMTAAHNLVKGASINPKVTDLFKLINFECKENSCNVCLTLNLFLLTKRGCAELLIDSSNSLSGFNVISDDEKLLSLPFGAFDFVEFCLPLSPIPTICLQLYNVQINDYNIKICVRLASMILFFTPYLNLICFQIGDQPKIIFPPEQDNLQIND